MEVSGQYRIPNGLPSGHSPSTHWCGYLPDPRDELEDLEEKNIFSVRIRPRIAQPVSLITTPTTLYQLRNSNQEFPQLVRITTMIKGS